MSQTQDGFAHVGNKQDAGLSIYDDVWFKGGLDSLSVQMIKTLSDHHTYIHTHTHGEGSANV